MLLIHAKYCQQLTATDMKVPSERVNDFRGHIKPYMVNSMTIYGHITSALGHVVFRPARADCK